MHGSAEQIAQVLLAADRIPQLASNGQMVIGGGYRVITGWLRSFHNKKGRQSSQVRPLTREHVVQPPATVRPATVRAAAAKSSSVKERLTHRLLADRQSLVAGH